MADSAQRAGWYPDPEGTGGERWWNGVGWSETRRAGAGQPIAVPLPPAPPGPSAGRPQSPYETAPASGNPSYAAPAPGMGAPNPYVAAPAPGFANPYAATSAPAVVASVNPLAATGLIFGVVSFVFNILFIPSIVAIVLSLRALRRAGEFPGMPGNGRPLAIAGLALGIASLAFTAIFAFLFILGAMRAGT